jgi:hypothetical protein
MKENAMREPEPKLPNEVMRPYADGVLARHFTNLPRDRGDRTALLPEALAITLAPAAADNRPAPACEVAARSAPSISHGGVDRGAATLPPERAYENL